MQNRSERVPRGQTVGKLRLAASALATALAITGCSTAELTSIPLVDDRGQIVGEFVEGEWRGPFPELLIETELQMEDLPGGEIISLRSTVSNGLSNAIRERLHNRLPGSGSVEAAVVVMESSSGKIRAIVTSSDPDAPLPVVSTFGRPVGSAFKPVVLAEALIQGRTLETMYPAPECMTFPDVDGPFTTCGGNDAGYSLYDATVFSVNVVYAQATEELGPNQIVQRAAELGMTRSELQPSISAGLGANPVTVIEMATTYVTLTTGNYVPPNVIEEVEFVDGERVSRGILSIPVLSDAVVGDVLATLAGVVETGTGQRADPGFPVVGKTGTALDQSNAWFVGSAEGYVIAIWVGFPTDEGRPMVPPATTEQIVGGTVPAELFSEIAVILATEGWVTAAPE